MKEFLDKLFYIYEDSDDYFDVKKTKMKEVLDKSYHIYKNSENYFPESRIDGVFIGDARDLSEVVMHTKEGWKIFIIGEIQENDLFFHEGYKYCTIIKNNNQKEIVNVLQQKSYIEVLYIFDENYELMILVDDYPEDISINIKFLSFMNK